MGGAVLLGGDYLGLGGLLAVRFGVRGQRVQGFLDALPLLVDAEKHE